MRCLRQRATPVHGQLQYPDYATGYVVETGGRMCVYMCVCVCVCVLEECRRVCGVCAVYAHMHTNLLAGVSFMGLHTISSGPHTE